HSRTRRERPEAHRVTPATSPSRRLARSAALRASREGRRRRSESAGVGARIAARVGRDGLPGAPTPRTLSPDDRPPPARAPRRPPPRPPLRPAEPPAPPPPPRRLPLAPPLRGRLPPRRLLLLSRRVRAGTAPVDELDQRDAGSVAGACAELHHARVAAR